MKKINDFLFRYMKNIIVIYVVFVVLSILFFTRRGDDFPFHMQRLAAIADNYRMEGIAAFPIRLYHSTLNGYGYASPLFYGDIFMQPFAILTLLGLSVINAYRIMMAFTFLATAISVNCVAKKIFKDENTANIFIFLYLISPTIFGNATGSAIGRAFSMVFVPLVVGGFFLILYGNYKFDWLWLGLGMTGVAFSNVIDLSICAVALLVILIFHIKNLNIVIIKKITVAAVLCIGLTCWFIFPMIEQMRTGSFFVTNSYTIQHTYKLKEFTVPLLGLLFPNGFLTIVQKITGLNFHISRAFLGGMTVFVIAAVTIFINRKKILKNKFYLAIYVLLLFFIIFQTKMFPFDLTERLIGVIQFPYRVNIVMTIILSFCMTYLYAETGKRTIITVIAMVSIYFIGLGYVCSTVTTLMLNKGHPDYSFSSTDIGLAEYVPDQLLREDNKTYYKDFIKERGEQVVCTNENTTAKLTRQGAYSEVVFSNNSAESNFEVPLLMYNGYSARYADSNEKIPIEISKNGLIQFSSDREDGTVIIWYEGTVLQKYTEVVSLIFFIGLLVYAMIYVINKKKKSDKKEKTA